MHTFTFSSFKFNIDKATALTRDYPVHHWTYNDIKLCSLQILTVVKLDPDHAMTSDLRKPVIWLETPGLHILIDGCHRMHKAIQLKRNLKCVVIREPEVVQEILLKGDIKQLFPEGTY
jgi:hypothetical protein